MCGCHRENGLADARWHCHGFRLVPSTESDMVITMRNSVCVKEDSLARVDMTSFFICFLELLFTSLLDCSSRVRLKRILAIQSVLLP